MIPTGNVTFLFTDIEGSTLLAQEFPESLPAALKKHHAIIHKATESNNGFVYEIVGDAFCCAFHNSVDAINAAIAAQINLANEKWDEVKIKIRIGIHSGDVEWNGKRYMGYITLARTARVMSSAYGEQIIISNDAYELAIEKTPNKISFRDLGERRLKDLKQPVRLYQILSEGLREDFPPLKTLDARPNNLPVQLTSFIGRETEMKTVKDLLKQTHLLTLTGSGGAGKTRLALQVAADVIDDFANGVWLVELASLSEPAFLPQSIMKVFDVKEVPKRNLEDTLCDYLKDKEILIILDNCEHLIEPCAKLTEKLLSSSPKLKIIATSREGLRCAGEQTHRVLSLEVPDPKSEDSPEALSQFEAVRLFIERALAVDSTFRVNNNNAPALAEICFQLDGIPLAIELAAARTKVLTVEQIYERLNDRFNLFTGGKRTALPRQQTLRALIDWSYDLLSEKEKILWARLSVFVGGWTLDAATAVCSDKKIKKAEVLELLNQLIEKSIIIFEREKERYWILESLKQYGKAKLKQENELEDILSKHLNHYMKYSEAAESGLKGIEVQIWLKKLELEHGNFQSAIRWSLKYGAKEKGARLAGALGNFWKIHGHYSTGSRLLENILDNVQGISKSVLGKILLHVGNLNLTQGYYQRAQKFLEEGLEFQRELRDKSGIASFLINLGNVALTVGNREQARKLFEESLTIQRELGEKRGIAMALFQLGTIIFYQGNYEQSRKFFEESLELRRSIRDTRGIAISLTSLGNIALVSGNYEQARMLIEESLLLSRDLEDKGNIAYSLNSLGYVANNQGDYEQAHKYLEESLTLFRDIGDKRGLAYSFNCMGNLANKQGNFEKARKYFEDNLLLTRKIGDKSGIAESLTGLGRGELERRNYEQAQKIYEESLALRRDIGDKRGIAYSFICLGNVEYNKGNYDQAQKFYEESLSLNRDLGEKLGIAESVNSLGSVAYHQKNYKQARKFYAEGLAFGMDFGNKVLISNSIMRFSGILSAGNKLFNAVLLLSAAEMALKSMGAVLDINEEKLRKKIVNDLQEKLSIEEFSKYYEKGKKLTLEQAAKLALSSTND